MKIDYYFLPDKMGYIYFIYNPKWMGSYAKIGMTDKKDKACAMRTLLKRYCTYYKRFES